MGFEEPKRTFRLVFEDEDFAGAEVICRRRVSMRVYFEIAKVEESRDAAAVETALRLFGDEILDNWNVEVDGKPRPANGDGMLDLSPEFGLLILSAWLRAVTELPTPLGDQSNAGNGLPVASMPMVSLSANPGN